MIAAKADAVWFARFTLSRRFDRIHQVSANRAHFTRVLVGELLAFDALSHIDTDFMPLDKVVGPVDL